MAKIRTKIPRLSEVKQLTFQPDPKFKRALAKVGLQVQKELEKEQQRRRSRLSRLADIIVC